MQDHATRRVGLEGFVVTGVARVGEQLDLQVELLARAAACPDCGGVDVRVKERPRVRVRDLPIAGQLTRLVWRKRRYRCSDCGRTLTETHEQLPAGHGTLACAARRTRGGWRRARRGRARGAHHPLPGRVRLRRLHPPARGARRRPRAAPRVAG